MNALNKITGASKSKLPHRSEDAEASKVLNQSPTRSLANDTDRVPASALAARAVAEALANPSDQWRNPPECRDCGKVYFVCTCDEPEPEQEHFKPGLNRDPDRHWVGY